MACNTKSNAEDPEYLKTALYKPKTIKIGMAIIIEMIEARNSCRKKGTNSPSLRK